MYINVKFHCCLIDRYRQLLDVLVLLSLHVSWRKNDDAELQLCME